MQEGSRGAEIALLVLGLILGCCWVPRGLAGLAGLAPIVGPSVHVPVIVLRFLAFWADPIGWSIRRSGVDEFRLLTSRLGALLRALPNCLSSMVAMVMIGLVIFLFFRARAAGPSESASQTDSEV